VLLPLRAALLAVEFAARVPTVVDPATLLDGDLVLHTSRTPQARAIVWATASPYAHVGLIARRGPAVDVIEAVQPVKLAMTAPVAQVPTAQGFVVQFVLPRDVTLETAPLPDDARVRLRQMPARQWAVIRYSGFWSDANYAEHLAKLTDALRQARQPWVGEPLYARYDPPITPWFLRRNEIWLALP